MDNQKLKILLLEDNQDDILKISNVLKEQKLDFELTLVSSKTKYIQELTESPPEIILSNYRLDEFNSTEAIDILRNLKLNIPFILLTDTLNEDKVISLIQKGCTDYVLKEHFKRLPITILKSVELLKSQRLHNESELKIKFNEEKYHSIIQHLPANVAILDNNADIIFVNDYWKLFADENGFTGSNYGIGSNYIDVARQKSESDNGEGILIAEVIEKISNNTLNDFSIIYDCHSPQKKRWFKVIASRENNGDDSRIIIMHIDVTEQQEAQIRIQQSEAHFSSIFNNTDIAFILLDDSLNIIIGNKIANLLANDAFGINSLKGHNLMSLLSEDKQSLLKVKVEKVIKGISLDEEISYSMIDGRIKWFRMKMNKVTDNATITSGFCLSVVDITDQVISRNKLEENEAKLLEAQKAAKIGNWETDLSNLQVIWSEETYKIFELDSKSYQPTHESFLNFVHPDDRELVNDAFVNSFQSKEYNFVEHRIITPTGILKYVEEHWKIIFDIQGLPISTFGTCQDITERKMVDLELINTKIKAEENEFRLTLAAESAKLGVWDWDIRENILNWDDTMYSIFGIVAKTNTNKFEMWANSLHPEDKEKAIQEVESAIKGEKNFDTSFRIVKPDNTTAYIKADGLVLCDMVGNTARMIGINRDITEQKLAEENLKNSRNRLINILQNSPIASCLNKLDHSVIFHNNQFKNLFGYTIEDIPNLEQWWLLAYPDENYRKTIKREWLTRIEHAQTTQSQFVTMDAKVRCKDGSDRFIEFYYANMDEEYLVNFHDITERVKYEEQLALSSLIINSIDDAIISKSIDGKVTSWNRAAEKLLGYQAHEIIGKTTDHLKHSKVFKEEEKTIIAKVNMGESVYHYETKRIRKDGEEIDVSLTISSILDTNGKVTGVSKILRDITYQKRMESEREKTINNLLQRNRDLEQFSYIISHNLRGPVATILGLTNLMNDVKLNAIEKKKIMDGVSSSVNNLDSVIRDLNIILQAKAQNSEKKKLILFSDLLNEVKLSLNDSIQNENVQIFSNFDEVGEIQTLKSYMYSIFYNLISNSIKYRQTKVNPILEIKSEIVDRNLILTFKDNGIGVDLKKHGHEVFGLNKRFNFNVEGKGLGLFMVKTQLEALGGTISIESEINRGSEFKIIFENYL